LIPVSFKKNFLFVLTSGVFVGIMNISSNIYFSRLIGPTETGKYAFLLSLVEITTLLLNFGFNQYLIKKPNDTKITNAAYTLIGLQSLSIIIVTMLVFIILSVGFSSYKIIEISFFPAFMLLVISRITSFYTTFYYSYYEANFNYSKINKSRNISVVLAIVIAYCFGLIILKNYNLFIIRDFLMNVFFLALIFKNKKISGSWEFNKINLKEVFHFSRKNLFLIIQERIIQKGDQFLIGIFLGKELLGVYFVIKNLFDGFLNFLITPIQTVMFAYFVNKEVRERMTLYIKKSLLVVTPVVILCVVLIWNVNFAKLLNLIYGKQFSFSNSAILLFILYGYFIIAFEIMKIYFVSIDKQSIPIQARLFQIFYFFPCMIICLKAGYSIAGLAFAQSSSYFLLALICYFSLFRNKSIQSIS